MRAVGGEERKLKMATTTMTTTMTTMTMPMAEKTDA
jgi:hypothetical protein